MNNSFRIPFSPYKLAGLPSGNCALKSLVYAPSRGLELLLDYFQAGKLVTITFPDVAAYRFVDEGLRISELELLPSPASGLLAAVNPSAFLDELATGSSGMFVAQYHIHVIVNTDDEAIDVAFHEKAQPFIEVRAATNSGSSIESGR